MRLIVIRSITEVRINHILPNLEAQKFAMNKESSTGRKNLSEEEILIDKIKNGLKELQRGEVYSEEEANRILDLIEEETNAK